MFMKNGDTLYLTAYQFNAARVLSELDNIIADNGGRVLRASYDHTGFVVNRKSTDEMFENMRHYNNCIAISQLETLAPEKRENARIHAEHYKTLIDAAQNAEPEKYAVTHLTYIKFIVDNMYYYYQIDNNPFFEFMYIKTPIRDDGSISRDACLSELNKDWYTDEFFAGTMTADQIHAAAVVLYNTVTGAEKSVIRRDVTRRRVANTYNGGWHYETVLEKERFEKVI